MSFRAALLSVNILFFPPYGSSGSGLSAEMAPKGRKGSGLIEGTSARVGLVKLVWTRYGLAVCFTVGDVNCCSEAEGPRACCV